MKSLKINEVVARIYCPVEDTYSIVEIPVAEESLQEKLPCGHLAESNPITGLGIIGADGEFHKMTSNQASEFLREIESEISARATELCRDYKEHYGNR